MEYLFVLSRVVFGGYFLYNAYNHAVGHAGMVGYAKSKGVPMAEVLVTISGVLLLLGGLGILLGVWVGWAVLAIELFMIPVTYYIHPFWKDTEPGQKMINKIMFTKNVAIAAAALAFLFIRPEVWMWTLIK